MATSGVIQKSSYRYRGSGYKGVYIYQKRTKPHGACVCPMSILYLKTKIGFWEGDSSRGRARSIAQPEVCVSSFPSERQVSENDQKGKIQMKLLFTFWEPLVVPPTSLHPLHTSTFWIFLAPQELERVFPEHPLCVML